jgi:hypothetical protein
MPVKKYTQTGIFSLAMLFPVLLFCIAMLFISGIDEPITVIIFTLIILTIIVCLLIFYKLTIIIDDTHLTFTMGIGLVRKSYPLSEIDSCKPVKNNVLSGVGIHMTSAGWLYNVSGKYAIELSFKNHNRKVRIGTDKPDEISTVINKQINGSMAGSYYDKGGGGGLVLILSLVAATVILPALLIIFGSRETEISFSDSSMKLSGMYGLDVEYKDIRSVDTLRMLPEIKSRTNGYSSGKILKGHFRLIDQSKVLLFIKKGVPPYIRLKASKTTLYLNFDAPDSTRQVYSELKSRMN